MTQPATFVKPVPPVPPVPPPSAPFTGPNDYLVRRFEHGVAIYGPLPVDDAVALSEVWHKQGRLGATIAVTSDADVWMRNLGLRIDHEDWLLSGDTGVSSKTIFRTLSGRRTPGDQSAGIPHDADDFGRCYRLLKRHPEWKPRLSEVVAAFPVWGPIVREWDALCAAFEAEGKLDEHGRQTADRMPKFYDAIQTLVKEAYAGAAAAKNAKP